GADVPRYRIASSELKAMNPVRGLIPVQIPDLESDLATRSIPIRDPVASLEDLLQEDRRRATITFAAPRIRLAFPAYFVVQHSSIRAVVEGIRTAILEWAIALEKKGVLGDEVMTFTEEEVDKAKEVPPTPSGVTISNVHHAVIQNASPGAIATVKTG